MAKKNPYTDATKRARAKFNSLYKDELAALRAMSEDDIKAITPGTKGKAAYDELINIVNDASASNLKQADLVKKIKELGAETVALAKKIPTFAALL